MHPGIRLKSVSTIRLRSARLRQLGDRVGILSDSQLADLIGVDRAQVSRVISGISKPGNKFIAGVLEVFGVAAFPDLFELVSDDDGNAA